MKKFLMAVSPLLVRFKVLIKALSAHYRLMGVYVRDSGFLYFFYKWVIRLLTVTPLLYYATVFLYWNYQYHSISGAYDVENFDNLVELVYYYASYGYLDAFAPQNLQDCGNVLDRFHNLFSWLEKREAFTPLDRHGAGGDAPLLERFDEFSDDDFPSLYSEYEFYEVRKEPVLTEHIDSLRVNNEAIIFDSRQQPIWLKDIPGLNPEDSYTALSDEEAALLDLQETAFDITPDVTVTNWDKRIVSVIPAAFATYLPAIMSVRYEDHYAFMAQELSLAWIVTSFGVPSFFVFDWIPAFFWECVRVFLVFWEEFRFIMTNELELLWLQEMVEYLYQPEEGGFSQVYQALEPYFHWPIKLQLLYSLLSTVLNEILNPRGILISVVNFEVGNGVFFNLRPYFDGILQSSYFFGEVYRLLGYVLETISTTFVLLYGLIFFLVMLIFGSLSIAVEYGSYIAAGMSTAITHLNNFFSLSLLIEFFWYLLEEHFEFVCSITEIWFLPCMVSAFLFFTYSCIGTVLFLFFSFFSVLASTFFLRVAGLIEYTSLVQARLQTKFEKLHCLDPYQEMEVLYRERYKISHFVEHAEFNSAAGFAVSNRDVHNHIVLCTLDQSLDEDHDVPIGGAIHEWIQIFLVFTYFSAFAALLKFFSHLYSYTFNVAEYFRYYSFSSLEVVSDYNRGVDKINQLEYDDYLYGYRDSYGSIVVVQDFDNYDDHFFFFYNENGHAAITDYFSPIINFNFTYAGYLADTYSFFFTSSLALLLLLFATSPLLNMNTVAIDLHQSGYNWLVFFFGSFAVSLADEGDGGYMTVIFDQFVEWWYVRLDDDEQPMWETTGFHDFETLYLISTLDRYPYVYQAGGGDVVGTVFSRNTRNINYGFPKSREFVLARSVSHLRGERFPFYSRDLTSYMRVLSNDFRNHLFDKYFAGVAPVSSKDVLSSLPISAIRNGFLEEKRLRYRYAFRPQTIYRVIGKGIPPVVAPKVLPGPLLPYIQMIPQEGESLMRKLQRVRLKQIKEYAKRKHKGPSMHQLNNKKRFQFYQTDPRNPERMKKRNKHLL